LNFKITYGPNFRQEIADSWPSSSDDVNAQEDWGWQDSFDLERTTQEMLAILTASS